MDRSLDEILAERQAKLGGGGGGSGSRGSRGAGEGGSSRRRDRRDDYPRDGVRKSFRDEPRKLDDEWVHDRFEEDASSRRTRAPRGRRASPENSDPGSGGTTIRVDNLHYELTQEDLQGLFEQIGPVTKLEIMYDRAGRSEGTAYVTYEAFMDAKSAIKEFDGAKAKGQQINLTLMPSGPARRPPRGSLFDRAVKPGTGKSLADRITRPAERSRSLSPGRRDMDDEATRRGIDRYIPRRRGESAERSPAPRGGGRGRGEYGGRREGGGRRPGERRDGRGGGGPGGGGGGGGTDSGRGTPRTGRDGRPKKTQEELDAEMADYFGGGGGGGGGGSAGGPAPGEPSTGAADDDGMEIE